MTYGAGKIGLMPFCLDNWVCGWLIGMCIILYTVQKVEQREREDEAAGIQKVHGGSGDSRGKHRPKKLAMAETKPSDFGERVVPVIDAALRAKVEAAAAKKQKAKVLLYLIILMDF